MTPQNIARRASVAALTLACASFSLMSTAQPEKMMTGARDFSSGQKARSEMQAQITAGRAALAKQLGSANAVASGGTQPAETFANPQRAYPPSCLESPIALDLFVNDPNALQAQIRLYGDPLGDAAERAFSEIDTVTLFRVVCSSGKSASLLQIDRPSGHDTTLYPIFPGVSVAQGANNLYIRLADDPNTFFATNFAFAPLVNSNVYVLENFYGGAEQFNYNQAFTLTVDNLNPQDPNRATAFPLPTYNPAQYSEALLPLPISGYMTGNWYDPNHSGEGIQTEIGELGNGSSRFHFPWPGTRSIPAACRIGCSAAASFTPGARSATVTLGWSSGGGFAGNFGPSASQALWGTFVVNFPTCNAIHFDYQTTAVSLPNYVPQGSGSKIWKRLTQMNGLTCE